MWDVSVTLPKRMTADEFLVWAMEQPEGERFELVAGEVVAMIPERVAHGRMKGRVFTRLAALCGRPRKWQALRTLPSA
jgi:Uma2 family endonuclease